MACWAEEKGLYNKYAITRLDGTPINPSNEYFILKLDGDGDQQHIAACRKAVLTYAYAIKEHLPQLAEDLIKKYGGLDGISTLPHKAL